MSFIRKLLFPFFLAWWLIKIFRFYSTHDERPILSEALSEQSVTLEEALFLIADYVKRHGKEWKIPLDSEIAEAVCGREEKFKEPIWALDTSRFWVAFRPSDSKTLFRSDMLLDPVQEVRCRVYLVRHEYYLRK